MSRKRPFSGRHSLTPEFLPKWPAYRPEMELVSVHFSGNWSQCIFPGRTWCRVGLSVSSFFLGRSSAGAGFQVDIQPLGHLSGPVVRPQRPAAP